MVTPRARLRRIGNLLGVIIPKPFLTQLGATAGDSLELAIEGKSLVLAPVPAHPRAGWAEGARRIAKAGDDAPVWPEFSNDGDAD